MPSPRRPDLLWRSPVVVLVGPHSTRAYPFADIESDVRDRLDGISYRLHPSPGAAPGIEIDSSSSLKRIYDIYGLGALDRHGLKFHHA